MAESRKSMRLLGGAKALAPLLPFVDLHLHALRGVDNGPASWSAAVELCVQAAHNGGFACWCVTTGTHSAEELKAAGAERVFADLPALQAALALEC